MCKYRSWSLMAARPRSGTRSPHINASEQEQPDHVDEMPIPGRELKPEMLRRREMANIGADQTDDEEGRANDHMDAVESGRHEERGTIDIPTVVECRMAVFIALHRREGETKHDRQNEPPFEALAIVFQKRVMRPGDGRAGRQQDQRIEQRQVPGVKCLDALRRPQTTEHLVSLNHADKIRADLMDIGRKQSRIEVGPEPRDEKHDLRRNKEDHAVAVRNLDDERMVPLMCRFPRNVAPPSQHRVEAAGRTERKYKRRGGEPMAHPSDGANCQDEN